MAGRPKLLATTKGNWPRRPGSLPASSALAHSTIARGARPSSATVSLRNSVRLWLLSNRTASARGHVARSASPGMPPPLPRSRKRST